jgi:hypothetical protein
MEREVLPLKAKSSSQNLKTSKASKAVLERKLK